MNRLLVLAGSGAVVLAGGVMILGAPVLLLVSSTAAAAAPAQAAPKPAGGQPPVASGPGVPGNPLGPDCPHPPVTQPYGPTSFGLEPAAHGYAHFHTGIDLACPYGTLVYNVRYPGLAHVTGGCSGYGGCGGGFGNNVVVEVQAPGGHFFVRYAHLSAASVKDGGVVQIGDQLGWEGSTGYSTGPHLHFEVDLGSANVANSVDPGSWLVL